MVLRIGWKYDVHIFENVVLSLNVQGRPCLNGRANQDGSGRGGRPGGLFRPGDARGRGLRGLIIPGPGSTIPLSGEVAGATALMSLSRRPMGVVTTDELKEINVRMCIVYSYTDDGEG